MDIFCVSCSGIPCAREAPKLSGVVPSIACGWRWARWYSSKMGNAIKSARDSISEPSTSRYRILFALATCNSTCLTQPESTIGDVAGTGENHVGGTCSSTTCSKDPRIIHPLNCSAVFFLASSSKFLNSLPSSPCKPASQSIPLCNQSTASPYLLISNKHFPPLHHTLPFSPCGLLHSTLASQSFQPSTHSLMPMCACALSLYSPLNSSLTRPTGSHGGRPAAISMAKVYSRTASGNCDLRYAVEAASRSLQIWAVRFWVGRLLAPGGGGTELGVSSDLRVAWSWLMTLRASWRDGSLDDEAGMDRVFEAGSICRGRCV